ncbi:MAG TPA: cupredoxin domain-containing protein [Gaiellaceae bacterium]|nr:cupredoxin domain-containing protein [Gaiellaceae bacterium]
MAVAAAAGLAAIAASPGDSATSGRVVTLALSEWKLTPTRVTVRPGRVAFVVRNDGTMVHELVVLRSTRHHHSVPVKGGRAVEKGRVGVIRNIPVGGSKRLTLKLKAGKYVLICNILGHYQAGQFAALRVR